MNLMRLPLLVMALSSRASAAPQLLYEAPAGCPAQPQFVEAVAAHGGDLGGGEAGDRVFVVSITQRGEGFSGAFQVRDPRGTTGKREVGGRSCSEIADALAMVTAIALQGSPAEPAAPAAEARPAVVQPLDPPPEPPATDRLRSNTKVFPARTETLRVPAGDLRFDLARTTSIAFGGTWGLVPSTFIPRTDLAFTLANFVTTPDGRQRISGLVYQLNVDVLARGTYRSSNTTTDIAGLAFGVSVCQSPLYDSAGLSLMICVGYGGGALGLSTTQPDAGFSANKSVGFGAVNATADLQLNLSRHVLISARAGGSWAIGDISAERADGTLIFKSSPWSGYVMAGVGVRY
jgi:hypothetical protein